MCGWAVIITINSWTAIGRARSRTRLWKAAQSSARGPDGGATRRRRGCGQRLVHDAPDGAGTAAALRTATEAMIDLAGRARRTFTGRERAAHVVVREHVTGTDDHDGPAGGNWFDLQLYLPQPA